MSISICQLCHRLYAIPVSPMRLQGNDAWHPLIDEARVEVTHDAHNVDDGRERADPGNTWRPWISKVAASLVQRTFKVLDVPFGKWKVRPYLVISELFGDLKRREMQYFQELEGVFLMNKYAETANRKQYIIFVNFN